MLQVCNHQVCHPFCLIQCGKLFLCRLQMIHRSEYKCEVKFIVSKLFKLCGIALVCLYFIALCFSLPRLCLTNSSAVTSYPSSARGTEYLPVPAPTSRILICERRSSLLIHQAAKAIVYILHGGDKLYPAVTAVQALFLVEFVIVFF